MIIQPCSSCTQRNCQLRKVFKAIADAGITYAYVVVRACKNYERKTPAAQESETYA